MNQIKRTCAAATSALIVALFTAVSAAQATPAAAVSDFYTSYSKQPFSGLPIGQAWDRISSRLSQSLGRLIVAAQKQQMSCQKAHPGDKPPWVEGDMFSSNFEGFTRFTVAETSETTGGRATVRVDFDYSKGAPPAAWRDQIVVVHEGSKWLIDDVIYARREGFTSGFGESLRKALTPGRGC